MIARRTFISVLIAFLALPLAVNAQQTTPVFTDLAAQVDNYFDQSDHAITFSPGFNPDGDFAFPVTEGVALFVDLQSLNSDTGSDADVMPVNLGEIILHPSSFMGGALLASDPAGESPVSVDAFQISQVISKPTEYRELCAFDHRVGGPTVAGTMLVTLANGDTVEVGAEIGTSMIGFDAIPEATVKGGPVISWPNKYCRGVKIDTGSCRPRLCGMTLGDMIDLAGQVGLTIPTAIIAAGVDAVADWLGAQGYAVSGRCGQVRLIFPPIPLGCQCIYVQF